MFVYIGVKDIGQENHLSVDTIIVIVVPRVTLPPFFTYQKDLSCPTIDLARNSIIILL